MNHEDHLRRVLGDAADDGGAPPPFAEIERRASRLRMLRGSIAAASALVVVTAVAVVAAGGDEPVETRVAAPGAETTTTVDDRPTTTERDVPTTADTTETTIPDRTTTSAPATTAPPTTVRAEPAPPPGTAVWTAEAGVEPREAALAFAREYMRMPSPIASDFHEGDGQSGEVVITPHDRKGAPTTVVLLRRIVPDRWSVIAAAARDIRVEQPEPGSEWRGAVDVRGTGRAFEGHIGVEVRVGGKTVGSGYVTAGCCEAYEPFSGRIEYRPLGTRVGGVVYFEITSAEDGSVVQASAVPVVLE